MIIRSPSARRWERHLAPLAIPTLVAADHPVLLEAACAAYADWEADVPSDSPMIEIRLRLASIANEGACDGIDVDESRLILTGSDIKGEADARTGRGECAVSARLLADAPALTAKAIDPILLFLLARMERLPLHAAGVMLGDTALLLAGPSGVGKSTLALAAAARGIPVLSDDTIHLQLAPRLRVWGLPRPIHVFPDEAPRGDHAIRVRAGKRKAAVTLSTALTARHADRAILIVLGRGDRIALEPVSAEAALATLMQLDSGFDLLREQSAAAIATLAAAGAWRLTLTDDPRAAIALLCETFRAIRQSA